MRTSVTAIVVAEHGGDWLKTTLAALADQTRPADRVVAVSNGGGDELARELAAANGVDAVVESRTRVPFGQAIARAVAVLDELDRTAGVGATESSGSDEGEQLLWLLAEDSAPEPRALHYLFRQVMSAPSVALAGPKLINWDHPDRIVELGQSLTRYGSRWLLRRQELDQQQYDHLQDVMGVGPAGMLVRRLVWEELGGFDPALPIWDDGLDFSVRARLAGHRVVVAPKARVRTAQQGVAGPRIDRRRSVMRTAHRKARAAQLHRRVSWAPALLAPFIWLALPVVGIVRMFWALLREQPGYMLGELVAALTVFFRPHMILRSRSRIRHQSRAGWSAVKPLRIDPKAVRTARMIDREAILTAQGRNRRELNFISTGGRAVLLVAFLGSVALGWWLYTEQTLSGGQMIPLSGLSQLWENTRMIDGIPADPFVWILALLGSLTFLNPNLGLVIFMAGSIPLAALGGWLWGAQFSERAVGRALAGMAWAFSPVVLGSIDQGRFATVVLAVALPWLLMAAVRAHESWSWAGFASLLAAIALACAPVLIPVGVVMWLIGMVLHPRQSARILSTAIAPAVLFLPKIVFVVSQGRPLDLFRDPGVTGPYEPGSLWHLLLGFPTFGLQGWGDILADLGVTALPATLLVGFLFLPLALLALLGLFTGKIPVTIFASLLGGLGMLTAILAGHVSLTTHGNEQVPLWTGSGLALYWIAIVTLAASGTEVLGKAAGPIAAVAVIASLVGVGPVAVHMMLGKSEVRETASGMPSIVQAAGAADPHLRTLVITAIGEGELRTEVVRGPGTNLDDLRTSSAHSTLSAEDRAIAELAGSLASVGAADLDARFQETGIGYVLLRDGGNAGERAAVQAVLDEHGSLEGTGPTGVGQLWRVIEATEIAPAAAADDNERTVISVAALQVTAYTIWVVQIVVLLGMILLALPTGEVVERPEKRARVKRRRKKARSGVAAETPELTLAAPGAIDLVGGEAITEASPEEQARREAAGTLPSAEDFGDEPTGSVPEASGGTDAHTDPPPEESHGTFDLSPGLGEPDPDADEIIGMEGDRGEA